MRAKLKIDSPIVLQFYFEKFAARYATYSTVLTQLPYFPFRLALICSLLVFVTGGEALLSVVFGFDKVAESVTWQFLQKQIISPLTTFSDREPYHHISKMTYRLVPPYLGKLCWECSLQGLMIFLVSLEYLAGFLFFYFSYRLLKPFCQDRVALTWLLIGICFTFLGKIFFWDTYAYFDAFALLFLLLSMSSRNPYGIFLWLLLAYWTDERALVASGLVWVWWSLSAHHDSSSPRYFRRPLLLLSRKQTAILMAMGTTLLIRWLLSHYYHFPSATSLSQILSEVKYTLIKERLLELIPLVTISSFEAYWLYILGACTTLWLHRETRGLLLYILAIGASLGVSYLVYDMTRSIMYAFPALFIGIRIMLKELPTVTFRKMTFYVMLTSLVYPTYYLSHYIWPLFIRLLKFNL